jgi:hypothetical protein
MASVVQQGYFDVYLLAAGGVHTIAQASLKQLRRVTTEVGNDKPQI